MNMNIVESALQKEQEDNRNQKNIIKLSGRTVAFILNNPMSKETVPDETMANHSGKKIPRPPNAFMMYANTNRRIFARQYPKDSNKDISVRLGKSWKELSDREKQQYYLKAKEANLLHKQTYPDYVYNPKEARIKKALRERERSMGGAQMGAQRQRRSPHWPKNNVHVPATQNNPVPMAGPPKDHHGVMRPGPEQGFMGGNGAYMYAAQNYPFSSPTDYQFVNQTSHWTTNTYIPNQSQVEQYTQFETERHRMQTMMQPNPGTSYMLPQSSQATSYHNIEHVPMMAPAQKPTMLDNLDSSSIDDRFLSLRDNLDEHSESVPNGALGINTSVADSIPSVEQTSNDLSRTHSLPNVTNNVVETLNSSALHADDSTVTGITSAASDLANISNIPVEITGKQMLPNVDAVYHQLSNVVDKSDNTFSGIQLFEDDSLANITTTPLTKSNSSNPVVHSSDQVHSSSHPHNSAHLKTESMFVASMDGPLMSMDDDVILDLGANELVQFTTEMDFYSYIFDSDGFFRHLSPMTS